jgi:hypothetical protein
MDTARVTAKARLQRTQTDSPVATLRNDDSPAFTWARQYPDEVYI